MGRQMPKSLAVLILMATLLGTTSAFLNTPPRIVKQPPADEILFQVAKKINGEIAKPFIIECEAQGQPEPSYRWIKNGKAFNWQTYDDRIAQQPGRGSLVITSPKEEDTGVYQCFAENELGTATSNSVMVRLAELGAFRDDSITTVEAIEGEPFSLNCYPPDAWPAPIVNWVIQSTNGAIRSINNSRITLDPEGTLWFSYVTLLDASDDFYYTCSATSLFRNEYKLGNRFLLQVKPTAIGDSQDKYPPIRQYVSRKDSVALRGKRIELFCIFGGSPVPQTIWQKNGQAINWDDRITQGHYGKSLVIRDLTFDDAGSYSCDVANGVKSVQSYTTKLKILSLPYFTVEPEFKTATVGNTIEFNCEASGSPKPSIQWTYNGKPIHFERLNTHRVVENNRIIIRDLVLSDTGNFGCNATNMLGYVYKDVYLNVVPTNAKYVAP